MRRALIGLVATTLGLLVVLHMPPVQWWLVSTALSGLQTRQSLDLTWRDVSFNLVTRSAQIQGLRLGARGASAPLVSAEQVAVRFPFGLFRGKLDGLDVTLANGTVTLARENGQWSTIPAAWTRSTPGRPPRSLPAFAALRLHDIAVVYDDRDARFRTETKGLRVDLLPTGTAPGDLAGDLVAGATTVVRWEPRGTTLTLRGGRAYFSPGGAGVKQLQLDAPEGRIQSDVRFAFKGTDRFALTARADLKADQLAGWVQALDTARGELQVDISMPAASGAPAFADITFVGPRFSWRGLEFEDLRGSGPLETRAITLKHIEVGSGAGPPRGRRPPGVDRRRRQPRDAARPRHRRRRRRCGRCSAVAGHRAVHTGRACQRRVHRVLARLAFRHARRQARHGVAPAPSRLERSRALRGHRPCAARDLHAGPGSSTWTRASTTAST